MDPHLERGTDQCTFTPTYADVSSKLDTKSAHGVSRNEAVTSCLYMRHIRQHCSFGGVTNHRH